MDILLAIRAGPVVAVGPVTLFGWIRRTCAVITSIASPYTARSVSLLTKLLHGLLGSADASSKLSIFLFCLYMPLFCLWWIVPQSTRVRVSVITITTMPYFGTSIVRQIYYVSAALAGVVVAAFKYVLSSQTALSDKSIYCQDAFKNFNAEITLCEKDALPMRRSVAATSFSKKLVRRASLTELAATLSFYCTLLQMALRVVSHVPGLVAKSASPRVWSSWWQPCLEASGDAGRDMYSGLASRHCGVLRQHNKKAALFTKLPWKGFSRMWGKLHNLAFPKWLLFIGLRFYVWLFACNLDEAEVSNLTAYQNLADFFKRRLREGVRPIDSRHVLTSPADGRILHLGPVRGGVLEQVKGVTYSMEGFLGSLEGLYLPSHSFVSPLPLTTDELYVRALTSRRRQRLWQFIVYLSPGDYHHFHSPTDWEVMNRRHFPGELFSVNPGIARWLQGLFNFNERVVYTGRWRHGFFSMTAVGATNVGSMSVKFDKGLNTHTKTEYERGSYFDDTFTDSQGRGRRVAKGELFGEFNLGSTIVLLFEAPMDFAFIGSQGQTLKYGQGIGHVRQGRKKQTKAVRKRDCW